MGKALKLLLSGWLINHSQEVVEDMLAKHPQTPPPSLPCDPSPPSPEIPEAVVLKAVQSFPTGSALEPSGLRATHLKEAILCSSFSSATWALQSLSTLVNELGAGHSPPEVTPHLCGASLLGSCKKGGGFHPIAVGEVLRHLTSKCLSRIVQQEAVRSLSPLQLGFSIKAGCEAIVHALCVKGHGNI